MYEVEKGETIYEKKSTNGRLNRKLKNEKKKIKIKEIAERK